MSNPNQTFQVNNIVVSGVSQAVELFLKAYAIWQAVISSATPAAITAAAAAWATSDIITSANHKLVTGLKGQVTTTGTEPTGISLLTDYFVRRLSDGTFSLYDTYAHAIDTSGTTGIVNITNVGVGDHTFTPTALADGTVKRQGSLDGSNWADIEDTEQSVSAGSVVLLPVLNTDYPFERLKFENSAGMMNVAISIAYKEAA